MPLLLVTTEAAATHGASEAAAVTVLTISAQSPPCLRCYTSSPPVLASTASALCVMVTRGRTNCFIEKAS